MVMEREHQMGFQALLVGLGLFLIIATFAFKDPLKNWGFAAFGLAFLGLAALWIYTDKRVLTQEEEMEQLLIQASQRYQRAGSMAALLGEYRAEGASNFTLSRIRNARHLLRQRAQAVLRTGITISGVGLLFVCGSIIFLLWNGREPEIHLLKYGLLGAAAGLGHIGHGLLLRRHARRFHRPGENRFSSEMPDGRAKATDLHPLK
jgi:hypothetical protein